MGHVLQQGRSSIAKLTGDDAPLPDKHQLGRSLVDSAPGHKGTYKEVIHTKSSKHGIKSWHVNEPCYDGEIVKHMSNLPDFLRTVEKGNSIREKALNFGVLDWKHLEKWTQKELKMDEHMKRQPSSLGPIITSGKQPVLQTSRFDSPERHSTQSEISIIRSSTDGRNSLNRHKEKETTSQECNGSQCSTSRRQRVKCQSKTDKNRRNKEDPRNQILPESIASSSKGKCKLSTLSTNKSAGPENGTRLDGTPASISECCAANECKTMEVLEQPQKMSSSRRYACTKVALNKIPYSSLSPHAPWSEDFCVDTPCTPPSSCILSTLSDNKCSVVNRKTGKPAISVEASDKMQEQTVQQFNEKERQLSPTQSISFNLRKANRSSVSKESLVVPQLSPTHMINKSSPVGLDVSSVRDNSEREKARARRSRSSPLKRLLDPLLKQTGGRPTYPATDHPPKVILDFLNLKTVNPKGKLQDRKKSGTSTSEALLQITLVNGLPLFKLVENNRNDMLVSIVKKLPTSGKGEPSLVYSFYSVHENRKGGNWVSQAVVDQNCSLGYDTIGQMKISTSYTPQLNTVGSKICYARECILYGVEPRKGNSEKADILSGKEIVAIVVNNVVADTLDNGKHSNSKGTVVVLPGGPHSGASSSLINRWRSGGACDCGGWDVGCHLKILTDCNTTSNIDCIHLFCQEGGERRHALRLEAVGNEMYSVELDASLMSMLEAFGTCVAYLTCQKFYNILDKKHPWDLDCFSEAIIGTDKMKTDITLRSPVGRI